MKSVLAPLIFSSVLFAAMFSKRTSAAPPATPYGPPEPSKLPPLPTPEIPSVPAPPWALPPLPPEMVNVKAGHRYEVVADVQAANGVSMTSAATKILDELKLDDPSLRGFKNIDRPGAGEVTRVTFRVTSLVDNSYPIETKVQTPGVGTVWVVSVKDVTGK